MRFLTDFEKKYSTNELELLAIIWAIEHFRNHVYGVQLKVVSDHKALMSVLKPNRGNKTFSSRVTRWVDRLLPFDFEIVHEAGRTLGIADYFSRHPTEMQGASLKAELLWNEWFFVKCVISLKDVLEGGEVSSKSSVKERNTVNCVSEAKSREPIKSQEARNSRESGQPQFGGNYSKVNMSENSAIQLLNEKLLPANYIADKTVQMLSLL